MKTMNTNIHVPRRVVIESRERALPVIIYGSRQALALLSAVTIATSLIVLGIWISGFEATGLVGAMMWGIGFVFLGIAVDKQDSAAITHLGSGLTMLVIALLQSVVSADFIIVGGGIMAAWAFVLVFRLLR